VRTNNAKGPRRSVQYLLSVDRALRKISLKRVSGRTAPPIRRSRSLRPRIQTRKSGATWMPIVVVSLVVLTMAVVIAQRRASYTPAPAVAAPPHTSPPPDVAPAPPIKVRAMRVSKDVVAAPEPVKREEVPAAPKASEPKPAPKPEPEGPLPVTITGCLERDHETFWLKDPSGVDVQKVRSWKSGFFKKRTAPIALTDAADASALPSYIGRRVAATGMLIDGQLRTRALQQIANSCN
jgi:hypothetical protein